MQLVPVDAIEVLINYLCKDEKNDFDAAVSSYLEHGGAFPESHVYLALQRVESWFGALTARHAVDYTVFPVVRCFNRTGDKTDVNE